MVALARTVSVAGKTYRAGTDSSEIPPKVVDQIRNPDNWVGGAVPPLSQPAPETGISLTGLTRPQARAALGLGNAATRSVGTTAGTVAAGDDPRFNGVPVANIRNINDYIPAGTNTAAVNCSPYVQAAINAAGVGGIIRANGRYRCDTELQLLNFQTIEGDAYWLGTGSPLTANCFDFRQVTANPAKGGTKVGFRLAASNTFRNLLIGGPGHGVAESRGISSEDAVSTAPRLYNVQLHSWGRGAHLYGAYYTRMYDCDFSFNGIGLYLDGCYNMNLFGAKFTCRAPDLSSFGTGIYINGLVRGLTMHGGSIEDYSTAIQAASHSTITLSGVYFETPNYVGATGIAANNLAGVELDLNGCSVYLLNHTRWVHMSTGSSCTLRGTGTKFLYSQIAVGNPSPAPTVPIAYDIGASIGDVVLEGDNWLSVYYSFPNQTSGYTANVWPGTVGSAGLNHYEVKFPIGDAAARDAYHYVGRNLVLPTGKTITAAAVKLPVTAKTTAYTLTSSDNIVTADATGGAFSVTLPTAVGAAGRAYTIKRVNSGANAVTVATTSGQTIDGASTYALSAQWQSVRVISDGANWIVA